MKILTATNAESPEELLNDLRALVSDAEIMFRSEPDDAGVESLMAGQSGRDTAMARFLALSARAGKTLAAGARRADEAVRKNPYTVLAIALSAGLLAGACVGRHHP